jgi:hypothetical protein
MTKDDLRGAAEARFFASVVESEEDAKVAAEARKRGISAAALRAERAVPTSVVRDLVNDFRSRPAMRSQVEKPERGTGWYTPPALRPPDGINHVDAIGQSFDVQERAAKLAELKQTLRVLKGEA